MRRESGAAALGGRKLQLPHSQRLRSKNSAEDNCSALRSSSGWSASPDGIPSGRSALRNVLRRWLKAALTTRSRASALKSCGMSSRRSSRMTPDFTFGGGEKTVSGTVNRYSGR